MNRSILILILLAAGCISQVYTEKEAEQAAVDYIENAPTFKFDGAVQSLEATQIIPLDCTGCFEVTVEFNCMNEGYGDRKGLLVIPKITHHVAQVRVEKGEITQATIDDTWDEMAQKPITE